MPDLKYTTSKGVSLLSAAAIMLCATTAVAQSARDNCRPAPVIPLAGEEPPAKIIIDPPLAEPLASRGVAVIQYCAHNLHLVPVFGPNAPAVSPRAGLFESEINIGDKFRVGSALVMVTEPRLPCYKHGIKFGRTDIVKKFLASERTGFYFAVLEEGEVGAGDPIERIEESQNSVRVSDITRLYTSEKDNAGLLRRAMEVEALPDSWKNYFHHRLETHGCFTGLTQIKG